MRLSANLWAISRSRPMALHRSQRAIRPVGFCVSLLSLARERQHKFVIGHKGSRSLAKRYSLALVDDRQAARRGGEPPA